MSRESRDARFYRCGFDIDVVPALYYMAITIPFATIALSMLGTTREVLCEVVRYGTPGGWDATMASGLNWWVGHPDGCGCNGEEKKVRVPGSTWGMSTSKKKCSDETLCEECLRL